MLYARIDLLRTDYTPLKNWAYIKDPNIKELNDLYRAYCRYKSFPSVMPIFENEYTDSANDLIGYYENSTLVAFSLIRRYSNYEAECVQFAWNYNNPRSRLGITSLKNECAIYKERGFRYLYLGNADEYKSKISGFEILGPL